VIHNASPIAPQALPPAAGETVLAIGRCVAQKGFDRLLAAWPAVHAARPAARLAIVGDGPLRRELQAQAGALGIADTLRWVAPTHDIVAQHAQAALFVLPSRYEGLPLVLLEAQALGRAAVAFDCPTGPAEVIEHGVTGLLVPEGDVAGLAAAIAELLADPARRAAMGAAAVERSRERFSLDAMLSAWTALLQRAARPGAAHG
jgi:glycosyltransferase involved in cell wall biosynthesis